MEWWIGLLRLLIAAALGFLIGLERKIRVKEAGIRTHAMVSLGAVSKYGFADMGGGVPRLQPYRGADCVGNRLSRRGYVHSRGGSDGHHRRGAVRIAFAFPILCGKDLSAD